LKKTPLILLLFWCLQYSPLIAQYVSLPEEYYSVDDGLSDRNILDIIQTDDGIVWLATSNGLNRFDGYETLVFNHFPNNEYKIAESYIDKLYLNKDRNLVIVYRTTLGMFEILNPVTFERTTVSLLPQHGIKGIPRVITTNPKGEVIILTQSSQVTNIYKHLEGNTFQLLTSIQEKRKQQSNSIKMLPLQNGQYLISDSERGLRYYSSNGELLHLFDLNEFDENDYTYTYPDIATTLHQDKQGNIWYSLQREKGIFRFTLNENHPATSNHINQDLYCVGLWEDEDGNILLSWASDPSQRFPLKSLTCIGTDSKIHNFDYLFSASKFIVSAFSKNFFSTIFLGIDTGLKIIQNRRLRIQTLLAEAVDSDARGAVMRGITSKGNKIYFSREFNAWYELDIYDNTFDTLQIIDHQTGEPIPIACGRSIHLDNEDNLWGVTCIDGQTKGVLFKYNVSTCIAESYTFDHPFSALTIDKEGVIWLCAEPPTTNGMLVSFDPKSGQFQEFKDNEGKNPIREASPRFILEASNGLLWIGTEDGLYKINVSLKSSEVFRAMDDESGLASNVVYAIHEDEEELLWIGTTNGFNIFNPNTSEFKYYSQKDGLASNIVCGFLPDDFGNYWITTYNGLSYFDRTKKTFRNFFRKDGLSHDEFNRFSYHRGPDRKYYMGGVNGVNIYRTNDLLLLQNSPKPIISKITRYNVKEDRTIDRYTKLSHLKELVLLPGDNYFSIHLTMPNFSSPRRNLYKAWLEGYDKNWTLQSNSPVLRYNKLSPGRYTLHIKGSNAYGDWSEEELILPIYVKPAFYETTWFLILCILFVAGVLYLVFQYRLEQQLKMERIRTRLSSDLHDEVSGLLSGIAMQTDVLQLTAKDPQNKDRLKHIGEVSRTAMSKMSDVIWSIDSRKDQVEDLIKRMQEHADEILSPIDIAYEVKVDRIDLQRKIPVTLRQNLYFIYKEAINNVAKHSGASKVSVSITNENNQFVMSIRDNGRGKHDTFKGLKKTGQGLSNLKMRAYRIDGQLDIKQKEDGFEVLLRRAKI
jgi:ligand-binding sensor domain-containing protein/two-component sensor histidine kinase